MPSWAWTPEPGSQGGVQRYVLNADKRVDDLAGLNELIGYRPGRGDGDGEADALGLDTRLRQARNQRVDADHLSL